MMSLAQSSLGSINGKCATLFMQMNLHPPNTPRRLLAERGWTHVFLSPQDQHRHRETTQFPAPQQTLGDTLEFVALRSR